MKLNKNILIPICLVIIYILFAHYLNLTGYTTGVNHDASWNAIYALRIMNGEKFTPYVDEASGRETLIHYTMATFFTLFGVSEYTMEWSVTVYGALGVALFYYLTKYYTKRRVIRFVSSLFFGTTSSLVVLGIVGWRLLILVPAIIFVLIRLKEFQLKMTMRNALLAGMAGGLCIYTYNGGRAGFIYPLIVIGILTLVKYSKKRLLMSIAVTLGSVIAGLPMLIYAVLNFQAWMGRGESLGLFNNTIGQLLSNFWISLNFFNVSANGNDFFLQFPLLEGPVMILWVLGIILCARYFKKYWVELLGFVLMLAPAFLSTPSYHRAIGGALPFVFIFVLIFLNFIWEKRELLTKDKTLITGLLMILILWQVGSSYDKLFVTKQPYLWGFYPETYEVGKYISKLDHKNVVIYAGNFPKDALIFIGRENDTDYTQDFLNYQGYTTSKADPIEDIIADFSKYDPLQKIFVVDIDKTDTFISAVLKEGYTANVKDKIYLREKIVAQSFTLVRNSK